MDERAERRLFDAVEAQGIEITKLLSRVYNLEYQIKHPEQYHMRDLHPIYPVQHSNPLDLYNPLNPPVEHSRRVYPGEKMLESLIRYSKALKQIRDDDYEYTTDARDIARKALEGETSQRDRQRT